MAEGDCLQVVFLNSELKEIAPKVARVLFDLGVGGGVCSTVIGRPREAARARTKDSSASEAEARRWWLTWRTWR